MDNVSSSQLLLHMLFWVMSVGSVCGRNESLEVTLPGPTITSDPFVQHHGCGNATKICPQLCQSCEQFPSAQKCFLDIHLKCLMKFDQAIEDMNNTNVCLWNNIQRPYNTFTLCSEDAADCLLIPWPSLEVEETFKFIHSKYFMNCPEELMDPPPSVVFALAMTPICIIPVVVVLVVLKTKNGDGSSW
ncbi:hypothetical protein GJAV_G00219080 [Gymnothorax javanicus]|nr:hypothetical protein GJAV_G00219080 [Gymnothorax javanicus]